MEYLKLITMKSKLTPREQDVLKLLARGLTSAQIASTLKISFHTVKEHRKKMLRKTSVHNVAQLVQRAMMLKWIKI